MEYVTKGLGTPFKLISNETSLKRILADDLKPVHVYLHPTNKCNLDCEFCSFAKRERGQELKIDNIISYYNRYKNSIKATTITGGGEPLMYKALPRLIEILKEDFNNDVGLETNGKALLNVDSQMYEYLKWCRVSLNSHELEKDDVIEKIRKVANKKADWSVFYVCGKDSEKDAYFINKIIKKIGKKLIYVKVVHDILKKDHRVKNVSNILKSVYKTNTEKIIFQEQPYFTKGDKHCRIWKLRTVIAADGSIYPCGRVHLAKVNSSLCFEKHQKIGSMLDPDVYNVDSFDGSQCEMCYFDLYNKIINASIEGYKHNNFI